MTYTISGTFSNTPTANVFSAQLSDAMGSFASPITIGTRTATNAGTISGCQIPYNTPTSGLYRIRVISSNPSVFGSDNGYNLTINAPTISTPTIPALQFCQGDVFNLSFTKTCNFAAGNVYTMQLSDASGSFASPSTIGTYTSTGSGTFSVSIPTGIPAGVGYRIRVVASSPVINGPDNGADIVINAPAGNPSVFGNGVWNVYGYNAFNNFNLNYQGFYTESSLSFSTTARWTNTVSPSAADGSSGSPYAGCPFGNTNYSVTYKRTGIPCGYYQVNIPAHDDYVYLIIDGTTVYQHVGCCDAHTNVWTGFIGPNTMVEARFTNGSGPGYLTLTFVPVNPISMSSPNTICAGTSATVSAASTASLNYSWSPAASAATPTSGTTAVTPPSTTVYTVTGTDATGATTCAVTNTVLITVNPTPATSVTPSSTLICSGISTSTLVASGANIYTWTPATGLSATSGATVIANPTVTTTYTVSGSNNCVSNNAVVTVSVQTIPSTPTPTVFGNNVWNVYCYNDLTATNYYGYYTENNLSFNSTTRWTNFPSNANATTGQAYQGCTVGTYHSTVAMRTNFTCGYYQLNIPAHDDNITVLINGSQVFQHIGCCDAHTNVWTGFLGPSSTVQIIQSNNGGGSSYTSASFSVIPYPVLNPPYTICAGTTATLTSNYIPGANYSWSPAATLATPTNYTTVASPSVTTSYTCVVTDPVTTCSASASVPITVNPLPATSVTPSTATVACASNVYTLTASGANTYSWSPAAGLSATTGYSVVASPSVSTVYTVTGNNNCASADATATVSVLPLITPTVFPTNTWNAYCYDDQTFSNYYGYYTENGSGASGYNFNTSTKFSSVTPIPSNANAVNGLPYSGCTLPSTNWSISFKRTGFACGTYSVSVLHDDYFYMFVNGVQVAQHTNASGDTHNGIWVGALNANSQVEFRLVQGTSTSVLSVTMAPVTPTAGLCTWVGGTSTDWFTASNWCGSGVPTFTNDALIPAAGPQYMPVIGAAGAQCKSITINPAVASGAYTGAIPAASLSVSGAYGLSVYGNWNNGGSFSAGTGTVSFLGSTSTTFSCPSTYTETFYNLVINKTGANTVTCTSGIQQVGGTMSLMNGIVNQNATLQILNGASVTGQSNASYVNGPVVKIGNSAFTFPVGTAGFYRPISISAPSLTTDNFVAQYYLSDPNIFYNVYSKDPSLNHISRCEYWILNRALGVTSNVNVTLTWDTTSCGVTNLADLRVARWDAGQVKWKDHGNGGTTGNLSKGSIITSAPVTNFSPFTLASVNANNPLPIGLEHFSCNLLDHKLVELTWTTATEINNHYFTVERSSDAISYDAIGTVPGAGNSTQVLHYSFKDNSPQRQISYYRLKQTDFDGTSRYSEICSVNNTSDMGVMIYPNPANTVLVVDCSDSRIHPDAVTIRDLYGKEISVAYTMLDTKITLDVTKLATGIYFVEVVTGNSKVTNKVTIQR